MDDGARIEAYLAKARESLLGAESECANLRFSNCANRSYYAAFQAAIAALLRESLRPRGGEQWPHGYVQAEFVGRPINRRRVYSSTFRSTLSDLLELRSTADYRADAVSELEAQRATRKAKELLRAIDTGDNSSS
jgi:uncharacterized protein (UPF0332 family)